MTFHMIYPKKCQIVGNENEYMNRFYCICSDSSSRISLAVYYDFLLALTILSCLGAGHLRPPAGICISFVSSFGLYLKLNDDIELQYTLPSIMV